ncbi:hypothetical protein V2J09_015306 [Rumex salicifolius]
MDNQSAPDLLSDLPLSIVESILTLLPIRDAIRTSILSSKWRYRWASLPQLVFDESCVNPSSEKAIAENNLKNFITHVLLLHTGPIHKFKLSTSYLQSCPSDIDQWLLFLSRNDIRELCLDLGETHWFHMPSCIFSCKKLTHLELFRCELDPSPTFKGFVSLKTLILQDVLVPSDAIESLFANCPLLENFTWSYFESLEISINAPNLKSLCLEGEFKEVSLEYTPLLAEMAVTVYMNDDSNAEQLEQKSSVCNFAKFLGSLSNLERLIGHVYFTKYLSIGIEHWHHSLVYNHLKVIELYQVSFEDMKEILVVLCVIMSAPNLHELQISGSPNAASPSEVPDVCFVDMECSSDFAFKQLKVVKITDTSGLLNEMKFIKFLLGSSPVLETMIIKPYVTEEIVVLLTELLKFRRASPTAEILFSQT